MSYAKLKISLPLDMMNKLFILSTRSGKAMSLIIRESLAERLSLIRVSRAANDNRKYEQHG